MLTNNFYSAIVAYMFNVGTAYVTTMNGEKEYGPPPNILTDSMYGLSKVMIRGFAASPIAYHGVYFGSGNTPATPNDYTIEKPIAGGVTISDPNSASITIADGYAEITATFGVSASAAGSDVAISEIGLFTKTSSSGSLIMLDRTVLDTPITIPAGQSKQITYTIRMNYPTA